MRRVPRSPERRPFRKAGPFGPISEIPSGSDTQYKADSPAAPPTARTPPAPRSSRNLRRCLPRSARAPRAPPGGAAGARRGSPAASAAAGSRRCGRRARSGRRGPRASPRPCRSRSMRARRVRRAVRGELRAAVRAARRSTVPKTSSLVARHHAHVRVRGDAGCERVALAGCSVRLHAEQRGPGPKPRGPHRRVSVDESQMQRGAHGAGFQVSPLGEQSHARHLRAAGRAHADLHLSARTLIQLLDDRVPVATNGTGSPLSGQRSLSQCFPAKAENNETEHTSPIWGA